MPLSTPALRAASLVGVALLTLLLAPTASAQILVTTETENPSDGMCSLGEAIQAANSNAPVDGCLGGVDDGDVIAFAPTVTGPIRTSGYQITGGVTIDGTGASSTRPDGRLVVSAVRTARVFTVATTATVSLTALAVVRGNAPNGGGIIVPRNGSLMLSDCTFQNNQADGDGGAVFLARGAQAEISDCDFVTNRANGDQPGTGGGAIASGGTLTINGGSTFVRNQATTGLGNGGAILNRGSGSLTIGGAGDTVVFSDNRAARAGGAIETLGTVTMTDASFRTNYAGINGGAIHMSADATVTVAGGEAKANSAAGEGGAFWNSADGTLDVDGTLFEGNVAQGASADQGGGAIYSDGGETTVANARMAGNAANGAAGSGGAVLSNGADFSITDTMINNNSANRAGAGVEAAGGTLELTNVRFQTNIVGTSPGNGGAVHGGGDVEILITGGWARGNRATEGGAYWISGGGVLAVVDSEMSQNVARGDDSDHGGGAVYGDGGDVLLSGVLIDRNQAIGTSGSGGGVLMNGGELVVIGTSMITRNFANRAGGGIELNGASGLVTADITGADISLNRVGTAPGNGGGLHAGGQALLTVTGGTVNENLATEGGGIWISGGTTAVIDGPSIARNAARGTDADQGGGGFYNEGGIATFLGVVFDENTAAQGSGSGGGLLNNAGIVSIRNGAFTGNRANRAGGGIEDRAVAVLGTRSVLINSVLFEDNFTGRSPGNGGALHITGPGNVSADSSTVRANFAKNEGGGFWNSGAGTLEVTFTSFEENRTDGDGGALYQQEGDNGFLHLEASLLRANVARAGGGLFAEGGTVLVLNSTIADNSGVGGSGGGLADGAMVTLSSVTISGNTGGFRSNDASEPVSLDNTIVFGNATASAASDLFGTFTSAGFNIIGASPSAVVGNAKPSDQFGVDPMLGPLADNGGPTMTFALMTGSPAIDAGWTALATDQRGYARNVGNADVGAFEFGATAPTNRLVADGGTTTGTEIATATTAGLSTLAMDGPVRLDAAAPNPMRDRARLTFAVAESQAVTVALYDVMGRRVQTLYSGTPAAETLVEAQIDGTDLAAGVYVVVLTGETVRETQRVTIAR